MNLLCSYKFTVNDLFRAQCAKERLVLVNILVEKKVPLLVHPIMLMFFHRSCQGHFYGTIHSLFCVLCGVEVLPEQKLMRIHYMFFSLDGFSRYSV